MNKRLVNIVVWSVGMLVPSQLFGAMSSTKYFIYADSVGLGGGSGLTSSVYTLNQSIGESPVGAVSSSVYEMRGGYQAMERGTMSLSFSATSLDLGSLDVSRVNSASTTATITSESLTGYSLSVTNVSGSITYTVSDGAVTAGQNEYGVAASGTDAVTADDLPVSSGVIVASASSPTYNSVVVLTFKASVHSSATAGSYSQSATFTASANF